jgi:hypothetical protein
VSEDASLLLGFKHKTPEAGGEFCEPNTGWSAVAGPLCGCFTELRFPVRGGPITLPRPLASFPRETRRPGTGSVCGQWSAVYV